jgi:aarF domain-containing kinase
LFEGTLANADTMTELKQVRSMVKHFPIYSQLSTMLQLAFLQRKQSKTVNLLLDVHGRQILTNGIFNGDPHPGNILMLSNGKLGLIDYGQCKRLEKDQRLALSKVVMELGSPVVNDEAVNSAMYDFGFRFKNDNTDAIRETARLFFDSDGGSRAAGCTNPQEYYQQLQKLNPFVVVPDEAVFVARTSFLFRGMGALLGTNIETSKRWSSIIVL